MQPEPSPTVNLTPKVGVGVISSPAFRSGWKTTEFWIAILIIALDVLGAVEGFIPAEHAATMAALTGAVYKTLRIALKWRQGSADLQSVIEIIDLPKCPACHSAAQVQAMPGHERGDFFCPCAISQASQPDRIGVLSGFFDIEPLRRNSVGGRLREAGFAVPDFVFAIVVVALIILGFALFTGCAGRGTRYLESAEINASATRSESSQETSGLLGLKLNFRDGRDGKTIKPLSLRTGVLDEKNSLGGPLRIPFRLDVSTLDERTEDVILSPDGVARILPCLERLTLAHLNPSDE